jgi:hypothetical protein
VDPLHAIDILRTGIYRRLHLRSSESMEFGLGHCSAKVGYCSPTQEQSDDVNWICSKDGEQVGYARRVL